MYNVHSDVLHSLRQLDKLLTIITGVGGILHQLLGNMTIYDIMHWAPTYCYTVMTGQGFCN